MNNEKSFPGLGCDELLQSALEEIHEMMEFARTEGKTVPEEISKKISWLCSHSNERSTLNPEPTPAGPIKKDSSDTKSEFTVAMSVHGQLCEMVAPATPLTIKASRPNDRFKFIANNATVQLLLGLSLASFLLFILIVVFRATGTKFSPDLDNLLSILAAAGLGSGFYGLWTAHRYLVSRTFDPKYQQVYLIRYVLGLTSGTILGYFGKDFITADSKFQAVGPATLALVGGYAAEAVSQILQRFAETLVTVVRGSNASELQSKVKQKETQTKSEVVKNLLALKSTSGGHPKVDDEIQKLIDKFLK